MEQQNTPEQLEQALRDFDRIATPIQQRDDHQIWRFEFSGRKYLLHFYRRGGGVLPMRAASGALAEFLGLQALQRESVPVVRPVAYLSGFHIQAVKGDVVILGPVENEIPLDQFFSLHRPAGPERQEIVRQVIQIVHDIGAARYSFGNLTLDCFALVGQKVYLIDGSGLKRRGGFRLNDLFAFAHDASGWATRTELLRGWLELNPGVYAPRVNPLSRRLRKRFVKRSTRSNGDFDVLQADQWSGFFVKSSRLARAWSLASRLEINKADWETAWPILLAQMRSGQLTPIKRDASGEVFSAEVILAGRPISVIVKRPRRKYRYRYFIDLFRRARAERMWIKAWTLISRNLPCEWPMLVMRRMRIGYTTDAVIVFERVAGVRLDQIDLDALPPARRQMLFRRAGRTLRAIERGGLVHYDSKSTNWIVYDDPARGSIPVMIDVDGIRPMNYWLNAWGILRLLRAMKNHPQYTPADSLALCQGFAPYAAGAIQPEKESTPSK